jgi:hypothetical protein
MIAQAQTHELDVADIAKFGNGPGPTQASVLAHELIEQFGIQTKNVSYKEAHQFGMASETYISGYAHQKEKYFLGPPMSGRVITPYKKGGETVTVLVVYVNNNIVEVRRLP